ncbi:PREDICTED: kunitz trypsin inhibitor 2-like [Nicotiana attenuata]|uniref:21 kDa seed protein n=1 Tax=Nicotiana attenuata TaxID=49451 RepID=A0A314KKZ2_NICAT|nr:PREDICTED: kunitz trypsin inhibitor 2-like [Nicotiana attenuata]OIT29953.1 21 kda seed protein [Nicotiana attenuata]
MNILLLSFILIQYFAFSLANPSELVSAGPSPSPVLDTNGDKIRAGSNYFVLPVIRGRGGGLFPSNVKQNNTCPRDIIQESHEVQQGLPVVFTPVEPKKGIIRLSTDLNVRFFTPTICARETIWKLGTYDDKLKQYFIVTGGVEGNPGPQTVSNWFKIEKLGTDYKFVFCPSVCTFCKVICKDVGIYIKDGVRFLALSDTPFRVMFKKTF